MALNCEDLIRQSLGRGMTEMETLEMEAEARRLATQARAALKAAGINPDVQKLARDWARRKQLAVIAKKRATYLQAAARQRAVAYALNDFKGMEWEGLSALMVGSKFARPGARMSVDALRQSLTGRYLGAVVSELERINPRFKKILRDDAVARDVARGLWHLGDASIPYKGTPEALEFARVIHKWQEIARIDENNAGAWIGKLPGYICRQSHDPAKLRQAGFEKWRDDIQHRLDWNRTADGKYNPYVDPVASDRFLEECWKGLVTGMHEKFHPPGKQPAGDPLARASVMGSIAAKASRQRILHFKDGDAWFDYNMEYGRGGMFEAISGGFSKSANDTALMRILGPNPQGTIDAAVTEIKKVFRSRMDEKAIQKMSSFKKRLDNQLRELDGTLNMEGNPTLASVGRTVRAVQSMAKLGGALISGFSDIPLLAQEFKYQGRGFFSAMGEGLSLFIRGRGTNEQREILSQCGVFFDSMIGDINSRFFGQELPGKTTAMMNLFFRINGLSWWSDAWKKSATLMMAHDLAQARDSAWGQLAKQRQRALSLYGIDDGLWEMIRHGKTLAADGRHYLTPEAVMDIPAGKIEAYLRGKGMLAGAERVETFRTEIQDRLRSYFRDRVQYAVLEPDARTGAILHQGQAAGTAIGEALRYVTQFKSFPVVFLQRTLGREVYGRGADKAWRGLLQAVLPRDGEITGLIPMILATTAFGFLSMEAKALFAGRTPRNPLKDADEFRKVFIASLVQGGGMGLYGDFLFGEKSRMSDDFMTSLAGPTLGSASSLVSLYKSIRDGEDARATAFRTAWSHLPGQNLFWAKEAINHLLLYSVYEYLNPGYVRRMQKRLKKETSQGFLSRPNVWDWAKR